MLCTWCLVWLWSLRIIWITSNIAQDSSLFSLLACLCSGFGVSCRFGKKLLKVLEKVWSLVEETRDLTIYILYRF